MLAIDRDRERSLGNGGRRRRREVEGVEPRIGSGAVEQVIDGPEVDGDDPFPSGQPGDRHGPHEGARSPAPEEEEPVVEGDGVDGAAVDHGATVRWRVVVVVVTAGYRESDG